MADAIGALLVGFAFLRKIFVLSLDIFEPLWSQTLSNAPTTTQPLKSKMWVSAAVNCRSVPASTKATHANLIAKIEKWNLEPNEVNTNGRIQMTDSRAATCCGTRMCSFCRVDANFPVHINLNFRRDWAVGLVIGGTRISAQLRKGGSGQIIAVTPGPSQHLVCG